MQRRPSGLLLAFAIGTAACGAGSGDETALLPGPQTGAAPGNQVIYASLSQDDRVLAYRLGADGFLPGEPFDELVIEEPRQVLVVDDVLYIAVEEGVASVQLEADGSMPSQPTASSIPVTDGDASQMIVEGDMLYVSMEGIDSIRAYPLTGGQISANPLTRSGESGTNYIPIELVDGVLYAATRDQARIDAFFLRSDGGLTEDPEIQDPEARIFDCKDLLHHNGILYAIEQDDRRLVTFTILDSGLLPYDFDSKTSRQQAYAYLALDGEDRLYASAFNAGRIDLYIIPSGGLFSKKQKLYATTHGDTAAFPTQMLIEGGILYVSQMGIGRIDAYVLGSDGAPPPFPSSSTFAVPDSYLNSITMGSFPP
jgi:6-phosphogluconolactonase (cycloisomerase 2 family)